MNSIDHAHLYGFCLAFVLSLLMVPVVRMLCIKKGLYDLPDERKIHKIPIPRLGGVAIWFATVFTLGLLILCYWKYPHGNALSGILGGGTIIFILGVVDDIYGLSPKVKLLFQFLAAFVAYSFGVQIEALHLPFNGPVIYLDVLSMPLTLLWIVAISNAVNFIDGVDGLAGGVATISALTLGVVAFSTNQPVSALVAAVMVGSLLGFLFFNFYPAKIFMGDSGSLFAGFLLASVAVTGVLKTVTITILLPIIILSVPLLDITFAVLRRLSNGKSPFFPDSEHIHHKLIKAGISHNRTIMILYFVCIASGAVATSFVGALDIYLILIIMLLGVMFLISFFSAHLRKKKTLNQNLVSEK